MIRLLCFVSFLVILVIADPPSGIAQSISGKSPFRKITIGESTQVQKVKKFPDLIIRDESFIDEDGNNRIDGNESAMIKFRIENLGTGQADDVNVHVSLNNHSVKGLEYIENIPLGIIYANESKEAKLYLRGLMNLVEDFAEFHIEVKEKNGFDAFPLNMKIETHPFESPQVVIADVVFSTENGGKLKLNTPLQMKFVVQNTGKGTATNIAIECRLPENCAITVESDRFKIDTLHFGENREFDFLFIATRRFVQKSIPVRIILTEKFNKYGQDTTISVNLDQELLPQSEVIIAAAPVVDKNIKKAYLTSSVDKNIPENARKSSKRFALVIGNEEYAKYQPTLNTEVNVSFARNDAVIFREYLVKTLGFLTENVYLLQDATTGEMNQKIDLIAKLAQKTGLESEIFFYYAGHGLPDPNSKTPYLIPVDVSGSNPESAIKLSDVYDKLAETNVSRITIFLDACFSGGGRKSGLIAARAVKIKPLEGGLKGNMVVFFAATGEQSALPYRVEKHGLFTYFLLKKLQETSGNITYGDLAKYLSATVSLESLKINQKEQDAGVKASLDAAGWEKWNLQIEK